MKQMETWQNTLDRLPQIAVPRIVASEPLQSGRFLKASKKTIEYPDGSKRPWEAVARPQEVVSVLARTQARVLILIAEYRPLTAPRWNISLPAGLVEEGYTKAEACRKELREETGYVGDRVSFLIDTPSSPGMTDETLSQHFMPDVELSPDGRELEPGEFIEVLRVPMDELDTLMNRAMDASDLFTVDAKVDQAVACARRRGYL